MPLLCGQSLEGNVNSDCRQEVFCIWQEPTHHMGNHKISNQNENTNPLRVNKIRKDNQDTYILKLVPFYWGYAETYAHLPEFYCHHAKNWHP